MRALLPILTVLVMILHVQAVEKPVNWKPLLEVELVDEWQDIFGISLTHPARPEETWAEKFVELQRYIRASTGQRTVPIFLSPKLAATKLPAIPKQERIGLPLRSVRIGEVLKYIANTANLDMRITDVGVLLDSMEKESQ